MSSLGMVRIGIWVIEPLRPATTAGALVERGQVAVEIAGIALAAGHLAAPAGQLAQRLGIVGHVGQDDQHVMSCSKARNSARVSATRGVMMRSTGGSSARFRKIAVWLSAPLSAKLCGRNRPCRATRPAPRRRGELLVAVGQVGLARDLRGQLVVRQARAGEDGQLLPTDQRIHAVDGRDAGLDQVAGIDLARPG